MDTLALDRLLRNQDSVVTRAQLEDLGASRWSVTRQIRAGEWLPLGRGVLIRPGAGMSLRAASWVAALSCPGAPLTGPSSAALVPHPAWARTPLGDVAYVIADRTRGDRWRSLRHPGAGTITWHGLPLADAATTAVDLLRVLPPRRAMALGAAALQSGLLTPQMLDEATERLQSLAGLLQLREIAKGVRLGAHSSGEVRLHRFMRSAGITGWIANHRVVIGGEAFVLDVAFPDLLLAIEFDGFAYHSGRAEFDNDRRRHNLLEAAGWRVLHVTWTALRDEPGRVLLDIQGAIAQQRAARRAG